MSVFVLEYPKCPAGCWVVVEVSFSRANGKHTFLSTFHPVEGLVEEPTTYGFLCSVNWKSPQISGLASSEEILAANRKLEVGSLVARVW
jgi:hypothetical protein